MLFTLQEVSHEVSIRFSKAVEVASLINKAVLGGSITVLYVQLLPIIEAV